MPNRYLRGTGARNWNDTANWSDVSGGAGGFSVPTSADNVIFDANSGSGTITVNAIVNILDLTCTNIGAITLANAAYAFNVYGSLTLHTNLTVTFTSTGYLYLKATDSRTITTNGKVANWNRLYFDGVGGTWTNQDDIDVGAFTNLYHLNGTWDTNGKTITTGNYIVEQGTKTLILGSSLFNAYQINNAVPSNYVLNAGTSTFRLGQYSNASIRGLFTLYNLEFYSTSYSQFNLFANVTVQNNLILNGVNSTTKRLLLVSDAIGTPRTITCNGTVTASNVDFRDITLAGTCNKDLSTITGGSGDCGGNSGITFTTAQPQYFKKYASTANYGDAANWFSNLALTVAGRVPLPQDLGSKFLATSFDRTCTVSCNVPRIPCLDMSEVVNSVTWSLANVIEVYGSYVLGANITPSGNYSIQLRGRSVFYIDIFNKTVFSIIVNAIGGIYTFNSGGIIAGRLDCYYGILDLNDYSFIIGVTLSNDILGTLYLGNGIIEINNPAATPLYFNYTLFSELSTIKLSPPSGSVNYIFAGFGKTYNKIQFSGAHTGNFDISGSNTIAELIIDSGRKVRFTAGTTQTIAKATIGVGATISSVTAATHTINYTGTDVVEADGGITVTNSIATPSEKWFTGAGSTDGGGNSGWIFGTIDDAFTPKIMWFD